MKNQLLKLNIFLLMCILITLSGCHHDYSSDNEDITSLSDKFWAHKVDDTLSAQIKQQKFKGLEVDLVYSEYQDKIFVGHEMWDTCRLLTFEMWMDALSNQKDTKFWLDMKNVNEANAERISDIILSVTEKYGITQNVLVENPDWEALKIVKKKGLPVLLWVDNLYWWSDKDTVKWRRITKRHIKELQPNGISCEYRMYPLLTKTFPEQNIHFWHTPGEATPENLSFDRHLAKEKSVKVILVDYDEPVTF